MKKIRLLIFCLFVQNGFSQDLGQGYMVNDLVQHPMQDLAKPQYLQSVADPSFPSTQIRRITNASSGNYIKPMYSTIQAWNADESLMLVYGGGTHQLLDGQNYSFIRNLTDVSPEDIETIFWSFTDPDVFFYMDASTDDLIAYQVQTQVKTILVNIRTISNCIGSNGLTGGNDIQMMSWDSDVFAFRCGNDAAYYYRISTGILTQFNIADIAYTAPMPFPSGNLFFHSGNIYDANGDFIRSLNIDGVQHSCFGKLGNGDDAYYNVNFEEVNGACQGTLVAHNATTGYCFPVTSYTDYGYPKSGTHISSLAYKNMDAGWVAVSCLGFQRDGVQLLDQELFIAKVNETDADVYRVAHHRSDPDEFAYFAEPHVTISPTGTRLLFGSDWSGTEDGDSVDSYVAELNVYTLGVLEENSTSIKIYPNPVTDFLNVSIAKKEGNVIYEIISLSGQIIQKSTLANTHSIDVSGFTKGVYFIRFHRNGNTETFQFIK